MPWRTVEAIDKQLERCKFAVARQKAFVETIEQSVDALSMEEVVKLFSTAFEQTCALKVVDRFVVNSLTHELKAAEVTAILERLERLH